MSLFGTSQPAQTSSNLFAHLNNPAGNSSVNNSTFSSIQNPPAATTSTSSLFNLPASSMQPQSNLFASLVPQSQQPQQTTGAQSTLGASAATTIAQASSTTPLGQVENQISSTAPLRHSFLHRPRVEPRRPGHLPALNKGIDDLLNGVNSLGGASATSKRLNRGHDILAASGVPRGATTRDLHAFGASFTPHTPSQPIADDLDIDAYVTSLRAKSTQDLIDESLAQTNRDFNTFLEENIQMNWQEQRQRIHEHFGISRPSEDSNGSQQEGRFGRSTHRPVGPTGMSFGASAMSSSILGGSVARRSIRTSLFTDVSEKPGAISAPTAMDDPLVRAKQEKYASKVQSLNAARKQRLVFPIIEEFARIETEVDSDATEPYIDAYRALISITKENGNARHFSELGAIRERKYAVDYLDENFGSPRSIALRKQILDGSRKFLEDNYFAEVDATVARNPTEANLGGVPSKINKVRALLRLKVARKDLGGEGAELQMLGEDYCWALIYHLLRAGLVTEAADYVTSNGRAFRSLDARFPSYIAAYARDPERRLPREMQTRINAEYSQRVRLAPENSIDPYRMACYKLVGRCDLQRKDLEDVPLTMKDWTWMLLSLAREVNRADEIAGEYLGLEDARSLIDMIGGTHFNPSNGELSAEEYATFFLMQILVGQFEKAIAYLYPYNYVTAVHFAIALDYYGLLRISDANASASELLTYTTRTNPQINFDRMIGYYTRDFRLTRAEAAADYVILFCLNSDLPGAAGESHSINCQQALEELVFETREFTILLGDMQGNGQKIPGAIQERLPLIKLDGQENFLHTLILQSASVADDCGRTTDAVLLYHIAEDYNKAVEIINRTLSNALTIDLGQDDLRLEPLKARNRPEGSPQESPQYLDKNQDISLSLTAIDNPTTLAQTMRTLYDANALYYGKIRQANRESCDRLLRLSAIRSFVIDGRADAALDAIADLDILPLRAAGNQPLIMSLAQSFDTYPNVVARVIGSLLIWTLKCLVRQKEVHTQAFLVNQEVVDLITQAGHDTMVFAGLIKYKLPSDVFELLARTGQSVGF